MTELAVVVDHEQRSAQGTIDGLDRIIRMVVSSQAHADQLPHTIQQSVMVAVLAGGKFANCRGTPFPEATQELLF